MGAGGATCDQNVLLSRTCSFFAIPSGGIFICMLASAWCLTATV